MTSEPEFDQTLRRGFESIREADARQVPDFSLMIARARADAAVAPSAEAPATGPAAVADVRWIRSAKRLLIIGAPLAAAAVFALWFRPASGAPMINSGGERGRSRVRTGGRRLVAHRGAHRVITHRWIAVRSRLGVPARNPDGRDGPTNSTEGFLMHNVSRCLLLSTLCLMALASRAHAQAAAAPSSVSLGDPIARALFEPELIMKHRRAIELTDQQRDAISRSLRELQGQVVTLQWELQEQVDALAAELARPRIDLDRAQDRMRRILQTERQIKEGHLTLLIRIKNQLTPVQQEALRRLRGDTGS